MGAALLGAVWWMIQSYDSPVTQALAGLLPGSGEDGVLFFISLFGPKAYEAYLLEVALPLSFLVLLLSVFLAVLFEVLSGLVRKPDKVLFFQDRVEWVAKEEHLVLKVNPLRGGRALDATASGQGLAGEPWWRRCRRRCPGRRFFLHPAGGLAIIPLGEPGWRLRGPAGLPLRERGRFLVQSSVVCDESDRRKVWQARSKGLGLVFGTVIVLLGFLLAVGAAGPCPWSPLLWALGRADGLGLAGRTELAADSRYSQTLYYYLATVGAEDDPAVTLGEYREVLARYFESGGESYLMRAEAAVDHLGAGTPEIGLSLLAPAVSASGLEFRLAWAAGGGARARRVLQRGDKNRDSSSNFAALLDVLEGRPEDARRRLGHDTPEAAQGAILRAVLWSILGEPEQAVRLVESPLVDDWRRAREAMREPPRTQTVFFAYREIRTVVSRAYAAAILDQPETADALWRWAEALALETGLPHSLNLDRRLWKRLEARFSS